MLRIYTWAKLTSLQPRPPQPWSKLTNPIEELRKLPLYTVGTTLKIFKYIENI